MTPGAALPKLFRMGGGCMAPEEFRSRWPGASRGKRKEGRIPMAAVAAEPIGSSKLHKQILGRQPEQGRDPEPGQGGGRRVRQPPVHRRDGHRQERHHPGRDLRPRHRRRAVDRRLLDRRLHPDRRIGHVPHPGPLDLRRHPLGPAASTRPPASSAGSTTRTAIPSPATPAASSTASSSGWPSSATPTRPARSWSSSSSPRTATRSRPLPHDRAGYFDFSTDLAYDRPQGHGHGARADGDRRRGQPPRGRDRPARDRLRVRRRPRAPPTAR